MPPKVFLIGAGPGDPGLITLRGVEALSRADVVLYDALAHPSLLEHARPDAELLPVGKRYGEESPSQEAINELLVALAKQGKTIARLKGGDPLLFARGTEEMEALSQEGIPFEIVPGVPSPTAAAAYAGISLTHRELSSSVALVTGTERPGKERTAHDWEKLATATQTLVFIMGMRRLAEIASSLVAHGRAPETPVAVVQWGTWTKQRVLVATLADVAEKAAREGLANPAVIIVGDVVRLRERMRWFDVRPLFGKRVLVTRTKAQAAGTARMLRERGAEPVVAPAIELAPPPDPARFERAVAELSRYDVVAFTSANAVDALFDALAAKRKDARAFGAAKVASIGPGTAAALERRGLVPDLIAREYRGEGLADAILEALGPSTGAPRRVLLPRALVAREALPEALRAAGLEVDVVAAYETRAASRERRDELAAELAAGRIDAVLFTSSSTVTHLCEALGDDAAALLGKTTVATIGPITSDEARAHGLRVDVSAEAFTIPGLLDALEQFFAA